MMSPNDARACSKAKASRLSRRGTQEPSLPTRSGSCRLLVLLLSLAGLSCRCGTQSRSTSDPVGAPHAASASKGSTKAAEWGAQKWLAAKRDWRLRDLRGQVVLLDFWTYCCINCMHQLTELARVEATFKGEPLAVVGVHSAKFSGERDPKRILDAMRRYGVKHPVLVDSKMQLWRAYDVHAWPTMVLIGPDGTVADKLSGEVSAEELTARIRQLMADAKRQKTLADTSLELFREPPPVESVLAFPGKAIGLSQGRIVVSDSGHHRLLIANKNGSVVHVVGSGEAGMRDGSFKDARFRDPQGLAALGQRIYVADTRNHAIRVVNLQRRRVSTLAGTGTRAEGRPGLSFRQAHSVALRSPWDLAVDAKKQQLFVALAGSHQIALVDLKTSKIKLLAGSGREDLQDGPLEDAAFAQPSGLSLSGSSLFVADSETSSIRQVRLDKEHVVTRVGEGLFDFGDRDGEATAARLQHPLGVSVTREGLLIADTYNHKLKHLRRDEVQTIEVDGLLEPGGVSRLGTDTFLVADTGHHRVLKVRLKRDRPKTERIALHFPKTLSDTPRRRLLADQPAVKVKLQLGAPEGHEFSPGSPIDWGVGLRGAKTSIATRSTEAKGGRIERLALEADLPPAELTISISAVLCDARDHAYCTPVSQHVEVILPSNVREIEDSVVLQTPGS